MPKNVQVYLLSALIYLRDMQSIARKIHRNLLITTKKAIFKQ